MADNKFGRYISGDFKNKDELREMIKSLVSKAVDKAVDDTADKLKQSFEPDGEADEFAKPQPIPLTRAKMLKYDDEDSYNFKPSSVPHTPEKPQPKNPPRKSEQQDQLTFDLPPEKSVYKYINAYIPHDEPEEEPAEVKRELTPEERARAKFGEMRLIGRINYHGFVTSEAMEEVFVKQARFMEDFTDDYEGNAFCGEFCPVYNNMTFAQLRTFFTWRVNARRGIFTKTDATYARLYAFELLNNIGTISQTDGMNRLIELWEKCRVFDNGLDYYMPIWIRDFYALSDIEEDYSDFSDTFPVKPKTSGAECEIAEHNYSKKLDFMNNCSSYNYYESKFYECPYGKYAEECLERVLTALDGYFDEAGVSLPQLLVGRMKESRMWRPFRGAIYLLADSYPNKTRMINPCERYTVKKGQWTYERLEVTAVYRNFNAYILKSIEAGLREKTAFRYSILPNLQLALGDFHTRPKVRELVAAPEFTQLINRTVDAFFAETGIPLYALSTKKRKDAERAAVIAEKSKPIKVEIDVAKLAQIRAVSDELTRKLIVDEDLSKKPASDYSSDGDFPEEQPYIEGMISGGSDDGSTDNPEDIGGTSEIQRGIVGNGGADSDSGGIKLSTEKVPEVEKSPAANERFSTLPPCWRKLALLLTDNDFRVLNAFFGGSVYNECSKKGIMAELVFEDINEKALDTISDNLIENGRLIDDYAEDVKAILDAK